MAETVVRRSAGAQPLCGAVGTRVLAVRQRGVACGVAGDVVVGGVGGAC